MYSASTLYPEILFEPFCNSAAPPREQKAPKLPQPQKNHAGWSWRKGRSTNRPLSMHLDGCIVADIL